MIMVASVLCDCRVKNENSLCSVLKNRYCPMHGSDVQYVHSLYQGRALSEVVSRCTCSFKHTYVHNVHVGACTRRTVHVDVDPTIL